MYRNLIAILLPLLIFFSSCNLIHYSSFDEEEGLAGFAKGTIVKFKNNTFGIDGIAYPNVEGSGSPMKVRYFIEKNSEEDDQSILAGYAESGEEFSCIFSMTAVGTGDWQTRITIVSF